MHFAKYVNCNPNWVKAYRTTHTIHAYARDTPTIFVTNCRCLQFNRKHVAAESRQRAIRIFISLLLRLLFFLCIVTQRNIRIIFRFVFINSIFNTIMQIIYNFCYFVIRLTFLSLSLSSSSNEFIKSNCKTVKRNSCSLHRNSSCLFKRFYMYLFRAAKKNRMHRNSFRGFCKACYRCYKCCAFVALCVSFYVFFFRFLWLKLVRSIVSHLRISFYDVKPPSSGSVLE